MKFKGLVNKTVDKAVFERVFHRNQRIALVECDGKLLLITALMSDTVGLIIGESESVFASNTLRWMDREQAYRLLETAQSREVSVFETDSDIVFMVHPQGYSKWAIDHFSHEQLEELFRLPKQVDSFVCFFENTRKLETCQLCANERSDILFAFELANMIDLAITHRPRYRNKIVIHSHAGNLAITLVSGKVTFTSIFDVNDAGYFLGIGGVALPMWMAKAWRSFNHHSKNTILAYKSGCTTLVLPLRYHSASVVLVSSCFEQASDVQPPKLNSQFTFTFERDPLLASIRSARIRLYSQVVEAVNSPTAARAVKVELDCSDEDFYLYEICKDLTKRAKFALSLDQNSVIRLVDPEPIVVVKKGVKLSLKIEDPVAFDTQATGLVCVQASKQRIVDESDLYPALKFSHERGSVVVFDKYIVVSSSAPNLARRLVRIGR